MILINYTQFILWFINYMQGKNTNPSSVFFSTEFGEAKDRWIAAIASGARLLLNWRHDIAPLGPQDWHVTG